MAAKKGRFGASGRALFDAVTGQFQLDAHELELLTQAAHTADTMAELQKVVDTDGALIRQDLGPLRPNPALVELRAQRAVYARLIGALQLPAGVVGNVAPPAPGRNQVTALRGLPGESA